MATTYATSSMLGNTPMVTMEKQHAMATIPDVADATTAMKTEARAPACQVLRPSDGTSSTPRSP